MKVTPARYDGGWLCECRITMLYLQGLEVNPRQMMCSNPRCRHWRIAVYEPTFEAVVVAQSRALSSPKRPTNAIAV